MKYISLFNKFKIIFLFSSLLLLANCGSGFLSPDWSKPAEPNAKKEQDKMLKKAEVLVEAFLEQREHEF